MKKLLQGKRKGAAVPLAMIAIMILLATGAGLLSLGGTARIYAVRTSSAIAARTAADTALTKGLHEINALFTDGQLGADLPSETDVELTGGNANYSYTITKDGSTYTITATGQSNAAQHTVEATVEVSSPFEWAIFAQNGFELKNGAVVDWYNNSPGDAPMKIGANSTDSAAIEIKNGAFVNGDIVVGPDGDPDTVVDVASGAEITGDIYATNSAFTPPDVAIPEWLSSLPFSEEIDGSTTLYTSAKYGEIGLGNSDVLTVAEDVTIYAEGIELGNSSEIEILENASLTIYLDGKLEGKNSSGFNNISQDPKKLKIYGTDQCTSVEFKNSSALYGTIYTTDASVEIKNSGDIYGAVISKSMEMKNAASFYYDVSLRTITDVTGDLEIKRWREYKAQ